MDNVDNSIVLYHVLQSVAICEREVILLAAPVSRCGMPQAPIFSLLPLISESQCVSIRTWLRRHPINHIARLLAMYCLCTLSMFKWETEL
jgi:hypothetical protein